VFFLLRLERKQAPKVSLALWIPTIWMLFTASKSLEVWFGSSGGDDLSGSPLDRAFLIGLLCLGLLILARRRFDWSTAIKKNIWLILLIGYMLVSILWSEIPFVSFKRWGRELIAIIMAFLVLTEPSRRQAVQSLIRRTVYILIPFSLLLIKYFPEYGRMYGRWSGGEMWIGVAVQKNGLGRLCLISIFFLVWSLIRRWKGSDVPVRSYQTYAEVLLLVAALFLLIGPPGAYPATAIVALGAGLAMFGTLQWMRKHRMYLGAIPAVAMIVLVVGFGIVTPFVGGSTVGGFSPILGRSETLTGRTDIWAGLLPFFEKHPILGHGFGGFWTPMTQQAIFGQKEAHNGYLDVFLGIGIVGLLLIVLFLLSFCWKAQRELTHDYDWASLCICYLLMALIHNVTESSINSFTSHLTAVLLFLAVSVPRKGACNNATGRENLLRSTPLVYQDPLMTD
jgi:O-antigen ligase